MKKNMIYLTTIIFFIALFNVARSDSSLIEQICTHTPNYTLCFTSLSSDPRSSTADVPGLALIMVDIIQAKATETLAVIESEMQKKTGQKKSLSACASNYDAILTDDIPEAVEALQKGDPKFAEDGTDDAAIEAESCEECFHGRDSPLTGLNKEVRDISVVASSIIEVLL